jgi:hypothetical protein
MVHKNPACPSFKAPGMLELSDFGKNRNKSVMQHIFGFFMIATITPAHGKHFCGKHIIDSFLRFSVPPLATAYHIRKKVGQYFYLLIAFIDEQ